MMKHRVFLPTAGVTTPRTDYDWDGHNMRVQQELEPFPENGEPVVVGLSSFGIGGSYGHVIIEEYTPLSSSNKQGSSSNAIAAAPHAVSADGTSFLLPLSAVSLNHLKVCIYITQDRPIHCACNDSAAAAAAFPHPPLHLTHSLRHTNTNTNTPHTVVRRAPLHVPHGARGRGRPKGTYMKQT